jgi:catechol 2,3-dioxygenase-like lactoylglutathione lyase family enzyme
MTNAAQNGLSSGRLCQIAFVVDDIDKASQRWAAALGVAVPQWHITDSYEKSNSRYHGQPTGARAKLAFFKAGAVDIELIEPIDAPSTWRDCLGAGGASLHHVAFSFENSDAAEQHLVAQGMEVVQTGDFTGGRYVYVDARDHLGTVIELLAKRP